MPIFERFNEKIANPNPNINFYGELKEFPNHEEARELLRALAAQVRPIMKDHGLFVTTLDEHEYNTVFGGRNFNAGEKIELVLRRPNGGFMPVRWLSYVIAHELAHCKHMNHGPNFQKLNNQLRSEISILQQSGYYGDGFWSSGQLLKDSSRTGGGELLKDDIPLYICPASSSSGRNKRKRRRNPNGKNKKTTVSGPQGPKRRKIGGRVTREGAFPGEGNFVKELRDGKEDFESSFRKRAGSKSAKEMRAMAAEKRVRGEKRRMKKEEEERNKKKDEDDNKDKVGSSSKDVIIEEEEEEDEEEDDDEFHSDEDEEVEDEGDLIPQDKEEKEALDKEKRSYFEELFGDDAGGSRNEMDSSASGSGNTDIVTEGFNRKDKQGKKKNTVAKEVEIQEEENDNDVNETEGRKVQVSSSSSSTRAPNTTKPSTTTTTNTVIAPRISRLTPQNNDSQWNDSNVISYKKGENLIWDCKACTFKNHKDRAICEICLTDPRTGVQRID